MVGAHLGQLLQALRPVLVVRERVVRIRHADLRVGLRGQLRGHQERDDAGQVGLVGKHLQVEHHLHVLVERSRDARRRPFHHRQLAVRLRFRPLDAALDVAHRGQVVGQLGAVRRPQPLLQARHLAGHRVEDAAVLAPPRAPRRRVGARPVAEQPLEERAGIALHRQRGGRRAPGEGADVGATEAGVAGAAELRQADAHLQRGELRPPAELRRRDLVDRAARLEVGALGRLGVHAGQERAGDPPVAPRRVPRHLRRRGVIEAGQHDEAVAERLQRFQDRRELEAGAVGGRGPVPHHGPVRHVDEPEARLRPGRRPAERGERRHHPVEQRQRHRGPQSAQHGAAGQRLLRDDHDSALLI